MVAGKLRWLFATAVAAVVLAVVATAGAAPTTTPLSGAIFTTDVTGVPVNLNIYAAKEDVYLNGGPGINAPDDAAGLPAGTYSFQVTDPSGKTLLSTDAVACRQFTVDASGRDPERRAVAARARTRPAPTARTAGSPCSSSRSTTPRTTAASTRCG